MTLESDNRYFIDEFVAKRLNLPIWGVTSIGSFAETIGNEISDIVRHFSTAVVLGHPLSASVLETIIDKPNLLYKHHYQKVNWRLDNAALELATEIQDMGYRSLPIPASLVTDWEYQRGHLSHRHAAVAAGLGWIGRNGLAVTPRYGSQVRWVTILTDMKIAEGKPIGAGCGTCVKCIDVCPAKAISLQGCDVIKCYEQLREFAKIQGVGQYVCGLCIKVCSGQIQKSKN